MNDLVESVQYFFLHTRRLSTTCSALISCLSFLIFLGLVGRIATVGHTAVLSMGHQAVTDVTLEQLIPGLPTWFVPETFVGYAAVALALALAIWGLTVGRRIDKSQDY